MLFSVYAFITLRVWHANLLLVLSDTIRVWLRLVRRERVKKIPVKSSENC
jgi:hypothetical protein